MPAFRSHRLQRSAGFRSRGVSLIEVLVATVILALGVLAVIALQLVSKRLNMDSHAQSTAAQLAYDMTERMRVNSTAVALAQYALRASVGVGRGQQGAEPAPNCGTVGTPCTGAQLAAHDVWLFEQQLDGAAEVLTGTTTAVGGLVNPTACITGPAFGVSGTYTVTIAWRSKIPLPADNTVACGLGLGLYGTSAAGECSSGDDCLRRTIQIQTYIVN